MDEFFTNYENLTWWLLGISLFSLAVTFITVPLVLIKLPADYFQPSQRYANAWLNRQSPMSLLIILVKNLLGLVFIVIGIVLLILPGQGLLTILIGLILVDFPGKYTVERRIVQQPAILNTVNWIRKKAGNEALSVSQQDKN